MERQSGVSHRQLAMPMVVRCCSFALCWIVTTANAQSGNGYDLSWSAIDCGGGRVTGGGYALSATVGQPDAVSIGGGVYRLTGGFWSAAPLPPTLDSCPNDFADATNGTGGERLSRFGCILAPAPPMAASRSDTAIRVVFKTLYNTAPNDPNAASVCIDRQLLTTPQPTLRQFQGQTRWLAAPVELVDEATPTPLHYIGAPLVCTAAEAAVRDWSPAALAATFGPDADETRVYFYDSAVVPCSVYEVSPCSDPFDEGSCSEPVLIFTGRMADAWPPFDATGQPSFSDINAEVNKFKGIPFGPGATPQGGAPEWHSLIKGNVVADYDVSVVNKKVSFLDIGLAVDGFKGLPYKEPGPCDPGTGLDNCGNACNTAP